MLSDFLMIRHEIPDNDDVVIYPIADVHLGAIEHMEREWDAFCQSVMMSPRAFIILGGDLINNATKSSVSNVYEETIRPREQKAQMVKRLEPLRERILCAVPGNHELRSAKEVDDDPVYDIMCKLDLEDLYRENIAFVKIKIGKKGTDGEHNPSYVIVVSHGAGGGILTGGSVNRAERFGYTIDGADMLIVGHTHKPFVTAPEKIQIDRHNERISMVPFRVVSCTSWLNYGGYAARKMLNPASHVPQIITLCGSRKRIAVTM